MNYTKVNTKLNKACIKSVALKRTVQVFEHETKSLNIKLFTLTAKYRWSSRHCFCESRAGNYDEKGANWRRWSRDRFFEFGAGANYKCGTGENVGLVSSNGQQIPITPRELIRVGPWVKIWLLMRHTTYNKLKTYLKNLKCRINMAKNNSNSVKSSKQYVV